MIPKVVVPANARIFPGKPDGPIAVREDLLVPRNLIPANVRMNGSAEATGTASSAGETAAASQRSMVPKLLVPAGARIASPVEVGAAGSAFAVRGNVFDEALLGKSTLGHQRSAADWLISLGVHAAIVAAVLIVPLFCAQVIDLGHFQTTYLVAPPMPGAPAPPPPPAAAVRQAPRKILPETAKLTMPIAVPKAIPAPPIAEEAPSDIVAGVPGGVLGGLPGGQIGGAFLGSPAPSGPPPAPPVAAPASVPVGPLHVGGQVKAPRAISTPAPDYPQMARQARIQGQVEIDAVIDKDGNVVQAHAMSGPQLLFSAALKAVSGWKYEPTYLNGQAYPVELTVHVTFSLG